MGKLTAGFQTIANTPEREAEAEFRGYYFMYSVSGIPDGNNKFGYWYRMLFSESTHFGSINKLTVEQKERYRNEISEVRNYINVFIQPWER